MSNDIPAPLMGLGVTVLTIGAAFLGAFFQRKADRKIPEPDRVPLSTEQIQAFSRDEIVDLYKLLRGQIDRESELIQSRLAVLLTAESFLFTAFAIAGSTNSQSVARLRWSLVFVLPVVGACVAILSLLAILAAEQVTAGLRRRWDEVARSDQVSDVQRNILARLPHIAGANKAATSGLRPGRWFPVLFLIAWVVVAVAAAVIGTGTYFKA